MNQPIIIRATVGQDDCDESRIKTTTMELPRSMLDAEVDDLVAGMFPATHCHHEHDCCGNWYARRATWTRGAARNTIVVVQGWALNI